MDILYTRKSYLNRERRTKLILHMFIFTHYKIAFKLI
jgi:hypothetical protein